MSAGTLSVAAGAALAALAFAGCCHSRVSTRGDRIMCDVDNSCLLVLNLIPLVSGDPDSPDECVGFEDTTTLANNLRMINRELVRHRADAVRELTSFRTEERVFFFLLKRSTLHSSAELVRNPSK